MKCHNASWCNWCIGRFLLPPCTIFLSFLAAFQVWSGQYSFSWNSLQTRLGLKNVISPLLIKCAWVLGETLLRTGQTQAPVLLEWHGASLADCKMMRTNRNTSRENKYILCKRIILWAIIYCDFHCQGSSLSWGLVLSDTETPVTFLGSRCSWGYRRQCSAGNF